MSHHNLNTDRLMAAAPGPACLIILSPPPYVIAIGPDRFTISVAAALISLWVVIISLWVEMLISLLFTEIYT